MKKSLLTSRRTWIIAGTAGALLLGSAAVATASFSGDDSAETSDTDTRLDDDGDDRDDDGGDDDGTTATATEVSATTAAQTALAEAPDAVVISVELDDDSPEWEVDLVGPDTEHEITVDAVTGEVRSHERDDDADDDGRDDAATASAATVTVDQAAQTALAKVPGVVVDMELDGDDNAPVWEVEVAAEDGTWKYVEINALDGSVISVNDDYGTDDDDDRDDDDDDDDDDDHGDDNDDDGDDD
ncbi:putative membrane protein YkoI [Stackebrandtia albiflava]|uniref:Putative membrane protein YkoI n=1 Tax=Stackebrandtia albiflava TaxID=406432 RepID=A0A562VB24_9ACTN|nr:PepSY domain-containing protein [Stackebrandtia albiflava]TWJ15080.1 putative membrane protein YkoI [Stackebrandtia albiflava]